MEATATGATEATTVERGRLRLMLMPAPTTTVATTAMPVPTLVATMVATGILARGLLTLTLMPMPTGTATTEATGATEATVTAGVTTMARLLHQFLRSCESFAIRPSTFSCKSKLGSIHYIL